MTEATPLASEQITQEDREAAAKLYEWFLGLSSSRDAALKSAQFVRDGGGDGWNTVQLFARHRIAALSASPAPSGQGVSGEVRHGDPTLEAPVYGECREHGRYARIAPCCPALAPSCAPGEVEQIKAARQWFADNGYGRLPADTARSLLAALSPQGLDAKEGGASCDGVGWVFFNEDAGEEYAPNHPVESGEVPDATRIRRSTAQEDVLWNAFQGEFQRANALQTATPSQRLDAATVERAARAMCVADGIDPDEHIIGGQATGFEDFGPLWQAEERSEGQLGLTNYKRLATAALATEPHQHGGKGA